MVTHTWFRRLSVRLVVLTTTLFLAATLIPAGNLFARTLICDSNPDHFTKRCIIHPNAVTRMVNGNIVKGHLVGCQFKSYTCLNGVCQNNYKPSEWHISPNMDEHQKFCDLLCQDPMCTDPQGWR